MVIYCGGWENRGAAYGIVEGWGVGGPWGLCVLMLCPIPSAWSSQDIDGHIASSRLLLTCGSLLVV